MKKLSMDKPIKVLYLITRLDFGGSAIQTISIVNRLRNYNFQTALAFGLTNDTDGSVHKLLAQRKIPWFYLPHLVRNPSPLRDLSALLGIIRLLKKDQYDLVHTHTSKAGTLGRLAAHWCGIPAVHTAHGHIFYGYFRPTVTAFYVFMERWMARYSARIISLTDDETRESLERGIGRPEQFVTIHSGVPLAPFKDIPKDMGVNLRNTFKIPADALVLLSVGRLVPIKGFDILLKAFARADFSAGLSTKALGAKAEVGSLAELGQAASGGKAKPVFLMIAGDGEKRNSLEALSRQLAISDRVRFVGEIKDIRRALSAADAFVLASRNEGMGHVFIEAMAAGLPVIGPAVGGVPSVIDDRQTGLLVAGEDPDALARALTEIAVDEDLRHSLGRNAAASVSPEYEETTTITKLVSLYRQVLDAKKRDLPQIDTD